MVRPLTKRTKKGVLYVRPQAVETALRAALREDCPTLRQRLEITEADRPSTSAPNVWFISFATHTGRGRITV